jgi:hypothetical protein
VPAVSLNVHRLSSVRLVNHLDKIHDGVSCTHPHISSSPRAFSPLCVPLWLTLPRSVLIRKEWIKAASQASTAREAHEAIVGITTTRANALYDSTFEYLSEIGLPVLPA